MAKNRGGTVESVWLANKKTCWICHGFVQRTDASRDHVVARSSGGYNKSSNYLLAHKRCNQARGALSPSFIYRLHADHPYAKPEEILALLDAEGEGAA